MKLDTQTPPRLPVEDYQQALRSAVSWLGDRHLLATPIRRRHAAAPFQLQQAPIGWFRR